MPRPSRRRPTTSPAATMPASSDGAAGNERVEGDGSNGGGDAGGGRLLYAISDSTGNLVRHLLAALLTQFPSGTFDVRYLNFVRTPQRLKEVLDTIAAQPGLVCHAVVAEDDKQAIERFCDERRLAFYDLTGGLASFLARHAGVASQPGAHRLHPVDDAYRRRIEALEFTLNHDDGLGTHNLAEADIVLVGVSRTSKTPTSIYLAEQGFKVANVALAIEAPVPAELLAMKQRKAVGLLIDAKRLAAIRQHRQTAWRMGQSNYGDLEHIEQEIAWSRKLFSRQGWPTLDVTDSAVEETAARVLDVLRLSPRF